MTRVSKRQIGDEVKKELEEQLASIIASLSDKNEIKVFLDEFLTNEEKEMLGKRLLLYMLLSKGVLSEDIHKSLSVTYNTIRLYQLLFRSKPEAFRNSVKKLVKKEKTRKLWQKIDKAMQPLELALSMKSDMKARAKFVSGE